MKKILISLAILLAFLLPAQAKVGMTQKELDSILGKPTRQLTRTGTVYQMRSLGDGKLMTMIEGKTKRVILQSYVPKVPVTHEEALKIAVTIGPGSLGKLKRYETMQEPHSPEPRVMDISHRPGYAQFLFFETCTVAWVFEGKLISQIVVGGEKYFAP